MAIDNLVNNIYAANIRIASSMDYLNSEEQSIITGLPSYESDKAKAAAEFLNNFYYKLPGGFLIELISRAIGAWEETGKDTLLRREMLREYKQVAEDVRQALLDSELSIEESTKLASLKPQEQKEYLFSQDNFYRLMPIMLEAYIALRKKGYKREDLIS